MIPEDDIGIARQRQKLANFRTQIGWRQNCTELFAQGIPRVAPHGRSIDVRCRPYWDVLNAKHRAGRGMMVFPGYNDLVATRAQRCGDREERKYVAKATFCYNEDMRHMPGFCFFIRTTSLCD